MTQPSLLDQPVTPSLDVLLARNSACARLANLLIARRGEWVDGRDLSRIGGYAAWRTRVSNLRKAPWSLDVKNRYRHVQEDGRKFVISEYRLD